jgi:hypothetical protein
MSVAVSTSTNKSLIMTLLLDGLDGVFAASVTDDAFLLDFCLGLDGIAAAPAAIASNRAPNNLQIAAVGPSNPYVINALSSPAD